MLLFFSSCTNYSPTLYQGYDVLNPPAIIKANPLGITEDGNFIVNPEFLRYVKELQLEVRRLRRECK